MTITSSLAATVVTHLGGEEEAIRNASTEPSASTIFWAKNYSAAPECGDSNDVTAANVKWTNLTPHNRSSWNGWLIIVNAVTPNDPSGLTGTASRIMLSPVFELGDQTLNGDYDSAASPNVVTCDTGDWIAVNPKAIAPLGCRKI